MKRRSARPKHPRYPVLGDVHSVGRNSLLESGRILTPMPLFALSLAAFVAGTEIRVGVEDSLLSSRFAGEFREYRKSVLPHP